MNKRLAIIILLTLSSWLVLTAQETVIVGDVTCAETGEPIPNANIYYQASSVGTSSNDEGSFVLKSNFSKKRILVVSAVGYHTQRFQVEPGIMAGIQVVLNEKTAVLEEVYASPDDSYALALLAQVKNHKPQTTNYQSPITNHQPQTVQSTELYVSDIEARQLKRRLWKSLRVGMITAEDSSLMLPLYVCRQKGDQKDEKSIIMSPTDYSALIGNNNYLNFYANTVSVHDRAFLSPLAAASCTYYKYYLADSVISDDGKQYILHFRSKNPYYATFNGEMTIDSATYTLRNISATVPPQSSVNYLKSLHIDQALAEDNSILSEQVTSILDFGVKTQDAHVFPTILIRNTINAETTNHQLQTTNHKPQTTNPDTLFSALDSLPVVHFAKWTAAIINTGYIPTGTFVDIGNIQEILQVNEHEKVHVGLPFRTNEKLMKHVSLEASLGYGFRDRAFKGMGRINVQLPTPRRHVFFVEYQDHYVWTEVNDFTRLLHENGIGFKTMDFTAYAFEALRYNPNAVNTATRQRQFKLHFDNDWTDNIETQLYARVGWMGYGDPLAGYHNIPSFSYQTLGGILRVGFKERKIDGYFSRYHVYSHLPVLYFGLEAGSFKTDYMASYQMFAKINLLLRHKADLGMGGTLDYSFLAGIILGEVPYPFLHHFEGNQGYAYDPFRFTLMNNFQYAADKYLALHAEWNGQGILFNLIPGIRCLRLRELVTFKLAYGNFADRTPLTNYQPPTLSSLTTPYIELGCGIGNILRVLDIYSVWRLTNWEKEATPRWALRFRLHISL